VKTRCLIIDDNESFLDSAQRLLQAEGLEIVGTASTGADGLRLATEKEHDVVLVDVELGDENGFDLTRRLTSVPHPVPVILISTYPEEDLADLLASSPAVGFLAKSRLSAEAVRSLLG
jgi:DNA-binding NarL/FixJ family response regulator